MTIAKSLPSQEDLRRTFDYLPEDGRLVWRHRDDKANQWNGRFAGRTVGVISSNPRYGYVRVKMDGEFYQAHRIIWKLTYGDIPNHMMIDHINGISDDNRLENLRLCTNRQNQLNRSCDIGRGYKGVYRHKKQWKAEISTTDGRKYLGLYKAPEKAAIAYDSAARRWHGEHARLNFPNVFDAAA